jgi:hypothetical protein
MRRFIFCVSALLVPTLLLTGCKSKSSGDSTSKAQAESPDQKMTDQKQTDKKETDRPGSGKKPSGSGAKNGNLITNGSFEKVTDGKPNGWSLTVGARSADQGGESSWSLQKAEGHGRVFSLTGDKSTAAWYALRTDPIAVDEGVTLRLSGSMKTKDVRKQANQYQNSNLAVKFLDEKGDVVKVNGYPVIGTKPLTGTNDWTEVEKQFEVPTGADSARLLCFLSMSGTAWFDDVQLERVEH